MIRHVVRQGDTVTSIAFLHGFFPDTVWQHGENAALREKRGDPDILAPGDEVVVPDRTDKAVPAATGRRHRYRRKGVPAKTRIQVFDGLVPRAGQKFTLTADGYTSSGTTDGDGVLEAFVPPDARRGELVIGPDEARFPILFGHLDPITEVSGVQKRLDNLGFYCGDTAGELGAGTEAAVRQFQRRAGLPVTGVVDDATREELKRAHDRRGALPDTTKEG